MIPDDEVYQGNDLVIVCDVEDTNQAAKDITGLTGALYRIAKRGSSVALVEKTLGAGIVASGSSQLTVSVTDDDTDNLYGHHTHELKLIDTSGKEATIFSKPIYFRKSITKN